MSGDAATRAFGALVPVPEFEPTAFTKPQKPLEEQDAPFGLWFSMAPGHR